MQTTLQKNIMRRVYYSFVVTFVTSGPFLQGLLLGGAVALFGRLTHVAAITNNVLSVPLGAVPNYVWNSVVTALAGGEVLTVLVTAFIVALGVMVSVRLVPLTLRTLRVV